MRFQDELALKIDNVVSRNETIVLVGDYNIKYFKDAKKQILEAILTPYLLEDRNNFMVKSTIVFGNANFNDNFTTLCFSKGKKSTRSIVQNNCSLIKRLLRQISSDKLYINQIGIN